MRILPTAVCVVCAAALGWQHASAQAEIAVAPVWETGATTELSFALIVDMASGPDGAVYVLDELAPGFSLLGHDGSVMASISGQGRGPNEFFGPADIAVAPDGSPVVLDVGLGRLSWYHRDGRGFRSDSSWIPPVPLRNVCYLNGRLFGSGTSTVTDVGLFHEFDAGHNLVRSFGLPDARREVPISALGSGRLLCVDAADMLVFLPDVYGRVFAFSPEGRLLWEQSLPGYVQMTVEAGPGWVRYTAPKQGYTHMGTGLTEAEGLVIAQYARVDRRTRRSAEAVRFTSVLLALGDGALISTLDGLPRLAARTGPSFFGFENLPVPRAIRYRREPWHIGQLPSGEVLVMVGLRHEDDVLAMPAFSIAVFDSTGAPLGSIPTPASLGTFGVSRSGPFVYLYEETPHPHIVKYRIDMPDRMERDE